MKTLARQLRKNQICFSTVKSTTLLQSSKTFSSNKPEWKSKTNVIITNPVLLLMDSCTSMLQLKKIQAHMTRTGLITHTFPLSRVLAFCALSDSGDISHADLLFTLIENPNTYMWNTMIRGYSRARMPAVGLSFFFRMVHESVEMDSRSFVFVLKACGQALRDFEGKSIHCRIWKMGFNSDTLVQNGLIHFYGVIGSLSSARQLFEEMTCRDVFSWTSMIDAYTTHNWVNEALELFKLMLMSDVEPNEVTLVAVISACSQKGSLELGKSIHEYIRMKKVTCSINLMNAISNMYVKCGCLSAARENFNNLKAKDVFSWTTMVNGYAKFGELDKARKLFDEMPERNGVSWNAMIAGYSQNNQPKEAIGLFHEMAEAGLVPMESTLVCVLSACGQLGYSELGQWIYHYYMGHQRIKPSVIITNAFIDMYAKCGIIGAAAKIFSEMSERNLVSWNSMIAGFASHGHSKEAIVVFKEMTSAGVKPDDITFVGVLSACTHGGLVTEGRDYFQNMERNFGLVPKGEHYACFIDLLGRTGFLEEAYELIMKMPMEPSEAAWGALLNACSLHGNVELAKVAATKLLSLNPEDSGVYVLLANICAHGRRWGDVRMVRSMMREMGVKKTPGCSLIEVEGQVHEFFVADKSHLLYREIYEVLSEISLLSKLEETLYQTLLV